VEATRASQPGWLPGQAEDYAGKTAEADRAGLAVPAGRSRGGAASMAGLGAPGIAAFLEDLAALTARRGGVGGLACAITLALDGQPHTVAASDALAARLEEARAADGDGPGLSAARTGQAASITDTADAAQWSGFAARAAAAGIRSVLSVPLTIAARQAGALSLYAREPAAFGDAERRWAQAAAGAVSGVLALAVSHAEQADLAAQLRTTLATRAVIDQALGIIMAEQRCSTAQAFDILRRASQNRNIKLRDIAARIVTGVTGQPPQPPPFITTPRRPGPDGRDGPARPAGAAGADAQVSGHRPGLARPGNH
jgi:GAF domain-containing protein